MTDATPLDDAKATAKYIYKEEAADGTAGADTLFDALAGAADGGGGAGSSRGIATAGFELFQSNYTINNVAAGQDKAGEEQRGREGPGALLLLRQE